jgi:hypothetical protein
MWFSGNTARARCFPCRSEMPLPLQMAASGELYRTPERLSRCSVRIWPIFPEGPARRATAVWRLGFRADARAPLACRPAKSSDEERTAGAALRRSWGRCADALRSLSAIGSGAACVVSRRAWRRRATGASQARDSAARAVPAATRASWDRFGEACPGWAGTDRAQCLLRSFGRSSDVAGSRVRASSAGPWRWGGAASGRAQRRQQSLVRHPVQEGLHRSQARAVLQALPRKQRPMDGHTLASASSVRGWPVTTPRRWRSTMDTLHSAPDPGTSPFSVEKSALPSPASVRTASSPLQLRGTPVPPPPQLPPMQCVSCVAIATRPPDPA